jgi:secondary thiamine-phosphate synthase enzyme
MIRHEQFVIYTEEYNTFIRITDRVKEIVEKSGLDTGFVVVITAHTTSGIVINEALECVESDMGDLLHKLVPEDGCYAHGHFLHSYGAMAGNPTGHLKSMLCGNHCILPVQGGVILVGAAQDIYFAEFDGPRPRTVTVSVLGE